jgi:mannitol/fructose-specific phosphotransferase system IIA component (Ntr-type)
MFVLGTPKSNPGDYLTVVSALCKILKDPANREAMMRAATPEAFIQAVTTAEEKLYAPVA